MTAREGPRLLSASGPEAPAVDRPAVRPAPAPDADASDVLLALDQGDRRRALTILMRRYGDSVFRYCCSVLRDRVLAEDVHQTVFVQAYQDLDGFSRRSSLRSWLYAIAHHRCLDALKTGRRFQKRFSLRDELPDEPNAAPQTDEALAALKLDRALEECIGGLQPEVRIAVLLRYREGFSYEEIGRICGERPPTLQARVARAMPALRQCLQAKGIER